MASMLQIQEQYEEDNSIKSFEKYAYQPISGTQLNGAGQITIRIENQDAFFYPRGSELEIEGKLVKTAGDAVYADEDMISLTNNGLMFLFDNIKYQLSGQEIESIYHPGHATTMLGLMKNTVDYDEGPGLNQCWTLDTGDGTAAEANLGFKKRHEYIIKKSEPKGSFSFTVPLETIFGFCEDYAKVMYGFIHTLTLVRNSSSNNAIFRAGNADAGKIVIDSIKLLMPKVDPSDGEKYRLYKMIEEKNTLQVGFRMRQCTRVVMSQVQNYTWRMGVRAIPEQPRIIAIVIQTGKADNQEQNISLFDHSQVTKMCIVLNNTRYPAVDFQSDFTKNKYDQHFKSLCDFRRKFYGVDSMVSSIAVDPITYKELFPMFVFDVSKQSERLQGGVVDISVEMTFATPVPANTSAYALLISDRKMRFQSDGKKMSVIV